MHAADAAKFFRDSPYTLGNKKGSFPTTVLVAGRWRGYNFNTRTCVPAMVCSRLTDDVSNGTHCMLTLNSIHGFQRCSCVRKKSCQLDKCKRLPLYVRGVSREIHAFLWCALILELSAVTRLFL